METPTIDAVFVILILLFSYVLFSLLCIHMVFGYIEGEILSKWKNSGKTKLNKIVHILKLEDFNPEKDTLPLCKKEQPFWYKFLEIFVGFVLWLPLTIIGGIWMILYAIYFCIRTTIGWVGIFLEWMFNINFKQIANKIKTQKEEYIKHA